MTVMEPVPRERRGDFVVTMDGLGEEACRDLLLRHRFGRVAMLDPHAGLTIHPVNYLVVDDAVLFRTGAGSALDRMCDGADVAFEVDGTEAATQSGWSVLVRGPASRVTDQCTIDRLSDTAVRPWAPGWRDCWIRIEPRQVTGRIIRRDRQSRTGATHLPYMGPS